MDPNEAREIIELAIQQGLVSREEVETEQDAGTISDTKELQAIDRLVDNGRLSEASVKTLALEISSRNQTVGGASTYSGPSEAATKTLPMVVDPEKEMENAATFVEPGRQNAHPTISNMMTQASSQGSGQRRSFGMRTRSFEDDLRQMGRYEFVKFLGEGGMGSVYQVFDPVLKRQVAMKFLHRDDPDLIKRLLNEGRAQAKIDHPNVCKVYEIGEVDGRHYIAMQFIAGETLNLAMKGMSLEQKVKIMARIAEALHAAHKEGLIHRDIKPHNLIVEKGEDGDLKPYVMDFGLAREVSATGMTVTGALLGTPAYMSPEQARGETDQLDRRTDVYSLGVTLYELLAGKVPFGKGSVMEVLLKVMNDEVPPLRTVDPHLPPDLETIVMKCLEKEPQQRYESAKALQEDLLRFLAGEPIAGRRTTWLYRTGRTIRRHKVAAVVMALSLAGALIFAGIGLRAQWQARQQAELARQFGEQVKDIEHIMRYGHMLPLHDVGREEEMVRERMKTVSQAMERLGKLGDGPGHYALGRGYIALEEYDEARTHLEQAWQRGYQEPEAAYALGLVLGELYQRRMQEVKLIGNKELRRLEQQKAEQDLKIPALNYLKIGRQAGSESAEYGEALMAFYDQRWEEALIKADLAMKKVPWLSEARKLAGDVYYAQGSERQETGNYAAAKQAYEMAEKAYHETLEMVPGDVGTYESVGGMWLRVSKMNLDTGGSVQDAFSHLIAACDLGLKANPRRSELYLQKARAYVTLGQYKNQHGEDPQADFDQAIAESQKALVNPRQQSAACIVLGKAYLEKATYQANRGESPMAWFDKCIDAFRQALQINAGSYFSHDGLGAAFTAKGDYQMLRGEDPIPAYDEAIRSYQKAIEINPKYAGAYLNQGNVYLGKGEYERSLGKTPLATLDLSIKSYGSALRINPKHSGALTNTATAYSDIADYQMSRGGDPSPALDQSIEHYRKGLEANPKNTVAMNNLGLVYVQKGQYQMGRGQDPMPLFKDGIAMYHQSLGVNNQDAVTFLHLAEAHLSVGEFQVKRQEDPTEALAQSLEALKQAEHFNPTIFEIYRCEGKAALVQVEWTTRHRQSPEPALARARVAFQKAIERNPKDSGNYDYLADCDRREAEWMLEKGGQPKKEIEQGLAMIQKAFAVEPDRAEAYVTQGALFLLQARMEKDPVQQTQRANEARQALEKAVSINPQLEPDCRPLREQAAKLARR